MNGFRGLTADEIDVRVGSINNNGLSLLLYKDARCDMNILDETVGAENWQREHYEVKGNMFCKVGINIHSSKPNITENGINLPYERWVWKSDCGTESNTEKEKGEASDSFKRACFNWGIGRELYTSPFIYIPQKDKSGDINYNAEPNTKTGKPMTYDKFIVEEITIENNRITSLKIFNKKLIKTVFSYSEKPATKSATKSEVTDWRQEFIRICNEKKIDSVAYAKERGISKETTQEQFKVICALL